MRLLSVNLARPRAADYTDRPLTGIDKRPADGPVAVFAPGSEGAGGSGVAGDTVCDARFHGGNHQAVYAYAREDLDRWERELGRELPGGVFGENLTTSGLDVSGALIGERWRIGSELVLEVTSARIPCRTFAGWLDERGWVKRFTQAGVPGAYLRVITPGEIRAGDPIEVVHRPDHEVTVSFLFRAVTTERELLPRVLAAGEALSPVAAGKAREYQDSLAGS
ncbi:MOSC domain-containing protein [Streptomyces palmae]|uniref:MOSC domain-containing protein n=1 Tax=Streptomyces palmae TaxID=1701085 RepID=A0A4Z0HBJ5_9ACTN|nr:MOSC domain-containing protein [Streptomyces palmae]TGB16556.1 MOSC domain-containing protein [Streptomyces palmae]